MMLLDTFLEYSRLCPACYLKYNVVYDRDNPTCNHILKSDSNYFNSKLFIYPIGYIV